MSFLDSGSNDEDESLSSGTTNVGCQNTNSQIQGDENVVALTAQQTFPELVQEEPSTTPPPPPPPEPQTCEECFTKFLNSEQITALESFISPTVGGNIEGLCAFWQEAPLEVILTDFEDMSNILEDPNLDGDQSDQMADGLTIEQLIDCLERVLGLQTE